MKLVPFKYNLLAPGIVYVYGKGTDVKNKFRLLSKERDDGHVSIWRIVSLLDDKDPFSFPIYKSWEQKSENIFLALPNLVTFPNLVTLEDLI